MFSNGRQTFWFSKTDFSFLSSLCLPPLCIFFATGFCQNCNFEKHFYQWALVSIRYFDFKCYITVCNFRKTTHNQLALMPMGDKCLQRLPQNHFFVISADDI